MMEMQQEKDQKIYTDKYKNRGGVPRLVHRLHWYDFVIFFKNEENFKKIEEKLLYILTYIIWLYDTRKINFNIFFLLRF